MIANADQFSFVKKLQFVRLLAPVGICKIEKVVECVSSIPHSYTEMLIIFAYGHLSQKLFVIFQEANGKFFNNFENTASNLSVFCLHVYIMTKNSIKNCLCEYLLN